MVVNLKGHRQAQNSAKGIAGSSRLDQRRQTMIPRLDGIVFSEVPVTIIGRMRKLDVLIPPRAAE